MAAKMAAITQKMSFYTFNIGRLQGCLVSGGNNQILLYLVYELIMALWKYKLALSRYTSSSYSSSLRSTVVIRLVRRPQRILTVVFRSSAESQKLVFVEATPGQWWSLWLFHRVHSFKPLGFGQISGSGSHTVRDRLVHPSGLCPQFAAVTNS